MNVLKRLFPVACALAMSACAALTLRRAVESGDPEKVAAQLDRGADLETRFQPSGQTPLMLAASEGRLAVARLLLERGADPNLGRNGTSALTIAAIRGDSELARLLLSKGAQVSERDLIWARSNHHEALARVLAQAKAAQAAAAAPRIGDSTAAASGVDVPAYRLGERPDDYAVVVGIERYMDAPGADYAESDAQAVRRHLAALGWPERNIVMLTGERASRAELSKIMERWLPNNVSENTRLFFYFAGDGSFDPATGKPYLLPWDGDAALPDSTGYALDRLYASLARLKPRQAIVVVDACFSGQGPRAAAPRGASPAPKLDMALQALGESAALTAAAPGGTCGALADQRHGALTYYLLQGLNGASDGRLKPLFAYAKAKAQERARADGREQVPQPFLGGLGEGDFRLR